MSEETQNGQDNTDPASVDGAEATGNQGQQQAASSQEGAESTSAEQSFDFSELSLPEGMDLDAELMGEFKPLAEGLKLDKESAQKVVDMGSKLAAKIQQQQVEAWKKQTNEWANQARADQEIGGSNFDANLGIARSAVEKLGTPELMKALDESGFGNHPELVRFMHRVGKAIGEDRTMVAGSSPARKGNMYAYMNK